MKDIEIVPKWITAIQGDQGQIQHTEKTQKADQERRKNRKVQVMVEISKERAANNIVKQINPVRAPFFQNHAAKQYSRESSKIKRKLGQLVREVNLIEQNKFSEQIKASQKHIDPTEELFNEEITESIKNEAGIKILNWGHS